MITEKFRITETANLSGAGRVRFSEDKETAKEKEREREREREKKKNGREEGYERNLKYETG